MCGVCVCVARVGVCEHVVCGVVWARCGRGVGAGGMMGEWCVRGVWVAWRGVVWRAGGMVGGWCGVVCGWRVVWGGAWVAIPWGAHGEVFRNHFGSSHRE